MTSDFSAAERLQILNQEFSFYRKRNGQVFFFGLLAEALILSGDQKIDFSAIPLVKPISLTLFFVFIAAIGGWLGFGYRSRIHLIKDQINEVLEDSGTCLSFPISKTKLDFSEIRVFALVLALLSISGIVLGWLNYCYPSPSI